MSALDIDAIEARADEQPRMLVVTANRESTGSLGAQSWIVDGRGNPLTTPIEPSLAQFIAAARSDVPALVALAREQAAEIARLRAGLEVAEREAAALRDAAGEWVAADRALAKVHPAKRAGSDEVLRFIAAERALRAVGGAR